MANGTSPSDSTTQPVLPPIGGVTPDPPPPPRTSVQLPTQLASLTTQPSPLPQTFAPLSQPQTYTGVPLPPLSTPADIPIKPPPSLVRSPDQLYAQATPAGRLLIGPESGWQNMVNDVPTSSGYAQGYYQITTGTWNDFAAKAGVDLKQYPTPVSAPFEVQQQVANVIPLGRWETKQALKDKYPWATDDMTLGQINKFAGTRQQDPPPEEREPDQWGKPHPNMFVSADTGAPQGAAAGAPQDFRIQPPTGIAGILQKFAIPLLAIASGGSAAGLALGITSYTAMNRAALNGQLLEYKINSQKWQTALAEHQARQQMESTDAGDAMAEFADDPAGLQQAMLGIADKYNDPRLRALAEAGDFDAIKRLQARRDMFNQPLMKLQLDYEKLAVEKQKAETERVKAAGQGEQQRILDDAVKADVAAWTDDFKKRNDRDPTENEVAQARADAYGRREAEVKAKAGSAALTTPYAGPDTWEGMPRKPPPGISPTAWELAKTWAKTGKTPTGLGQRTSALYQEVAQALPVAMQALGIEDLGNQAITYEAKRTQLQAIERAFGSGVMGKNLVSLNTVADHISLFRQYAEALKTGDTQRINQLQQRFATETGSPEVIDFALAGRITGDEVVRTLTTTGGTITDREDIASRLAAYNSPTQFEGAANTLTNFVRSRYEPMRVAYAHGDPERAKDFNENMVTPEARSLFQGPQAPIPGATTPPATPQQTTPPVEGLANVPNAGRQDGGLTVGQKYGPDKNGGYGIYLGKNPNNPTDLSNWQEVPG